MSRGSRTVLAVCVGLLIAFGLSFGINFGLAAAGAEPVAPVWIAAVAIGSFVALRIMNAGGKKRTQTADGTTRQAALSGPPDPGSARVIVFREGFMGKRNGVNVSADGRDIAQLMSPQFTMATLPPGRHTLAAALAGTANAASAAGQAVFDAAAGQTVIFQIKLAMKMTTSDIVLTRVEDDAAVQQKLASMKMVLAPS